MDNLTCLLAVVGDGVTLHHWHKDTNRWGWVIVEEVLQLSVEGKW